MLTDDLARAYALLPEIACKGLCQEACGPIGMTEREYERMRRKGGHRTTTTADLTCPYLNAEGRCDVYAARPMVCRAWGGVEGMECPWGCAPVIMPRDALVPIAELVEGTPGARMVLISVSPEASGPMAAIARNAERMLLAQGFVPLTRI